MLSLTSRSKARMDRRKLQWRGFCERLPPRVIQERRKQKEKHLSGHETLVVGLGDRSYDVRIGEGLIGRAGEHLRPLLHSPRVLIVTDTAVRDLHLPTLQRAFDAAAIQHQTFVVPAERGARASIPSRVFVKTSFGQASIGVPPL